MSSKKQRRETFKEDDNYDSFLRAEELFNHPGTGMPLIFRPITEEEKPTETEPLTAESKPKEEEPITEEKKPTEEHTENKQNKALGGQEGSADKDTPTNEKKPAEANKTAELKPWICRKCDTVNDAAAKVCKQCQTKKTVKANNKPFRARRNPNEPNNKRFQLIIPESLFKEIDAISSLRGISVNYIMREALIEYADAHTEEIEAWNEITTPKGDKK